MVGIFTVRFLDPKGFLSMKFLLKISLKRRFWMTFKRFENRVNSDIESVSRRNVKSGAETGPQL